MTLNDRINSAIISNYQISDALQQNTNLGITVTTPIVTQATENSTFSFSRNAYDVLDTLGLGGFGPKEEYPVYGPMTKEQAEAKKRKESGTDILGSFLGLFKKQDPNDAAPFKGVHFPRSCGGDGHCQFGR
jgi:hypothetical protein